MMVDIKEKFGGFGGSFGNLTDIIVSLIFAIAGIIVIFLFIFGGYKLISSAGGGDARGAEQGKQAVTWAIIGFAVVLLGFAIVQLVADLTGNQFLSLP